MAEWSGWDRVACLVVGLALVLGAWPREPLAATAGKLGFIDLKRIERESGLGRRLAQELKEEDAKDAEARKALDEEAAELRRSADAMSPEGLKQKQEALREKLQVLEQRSAERRKTKEARDLRSRQEFRKKIKQVIQAYATEEGFIAVFQAGRQIHERS